MHNKQYFIKYDGMFSCIENREPEYEGEGGGFVFYRFAQRQLIIDLTRDINDLKKCLKDVKATKEIQVIQWSQQEDINRLEKE